MRISLLLLLAFSTSIVATGQNNTWTWSLDDQAFAFVGQLSGTPLIAVVDTSVDRHGELVMAIIQHAIPGATVRLFDSELHFKELRCDELWGAEFYSVLWLACLHKSIYLTLRDAVAWQPQAINLSLGFLDTDNIFIAKYLAPKPCTEFPSGLWYSEVAALIAQGQRDGIAFVAAATNASLSGRVGFPACLPDVYASAALKRQERYATETLQVAGYSSLVPEAFVSPIGGRLFDPLGVEYQGTSFSTPILTALVAAAKYNCRDELSVLGKTRITVMRPPLPWVLRVPTAADIGYCVAEISKRRRAN